MTHPQPADRASIERLAHTLWMARGCPLGSPEEDWLQAERMLAEDTAGEAPPPLAAPAEAAAATAPRRRSGGPAGARRSGGGHRA
ncbi:MAG: DUF2934 domain-containing protein [Steroidobacteraceae bacterium]|jgi:hypothetical protein|nr:DUF2934 domain-containing protein [Steroidobacteraceae bacterium]